MTRTGFAADSKDDHPDPAGALVATDGDRTAVWLSGEHDLATMGQLTIALAEAISTEDRDVVVDMSYLTFMDASVLGLLIRCRDFLAARGRRLTLRSPPRCARLLLDLSELDATIEAVPDDGRPLVAASALETWVTVPLGDAARPTYSAPVRSPDHDDPEVVFG